MNSTTDFRTVEKPENGATLALVLLRSFMSPFLAAIAPRLFMILFRFAQPLLMSQAIQFVMRPKTTETDKGAALRIVIAATIVYTGIAVSAIENEVMGSFQDVATDNAKTHSGIHRGLPTPAEPPSSNVAWRSHRPAS